MRRLGIAVVAVVGVVMPALVGAEQVSGKKRRPLPPEFGRVVLDAESRKAGVPGVGFDHWLHRSRYTCRLCHVDIGFAMTANGTKVKAADNAAGFYCGACHDGKRVVEGRKVFESCGKGSPQDVRGSCLRCHSVGKDVKPQVDFAAFTKGLPKGRLGNGVDWELAEEKGLIKPVDFLEGVSVPRKSLAAQKDFALSPKLEGMPEIIFSHAKHTVWNGCELCHPEIFGAVKKGSVKYTMSEIFEGKYCGVCHVTVAFPMQDCQRCHAKAVK
jgi:c(7)-type cytochrome triheme protein